MVGKAALPTPSLPEQAYQTLRALILDFSLLPGQQLVVTDLAQRLGMSRTPVREALVRLASEGLVENVPQKGTYVAVPTAEVFREVYEIVEGIEGQAAKLAAARVDETTIRRLEESVAAQEAALAADDVAAWANADAEFHDLIIEATGNRRMREVMRQFEGQMKRVRLAIIYRRRKPVQSVAEHRAVVAAIRAGDGDLARQLHLAHRDRAFSEFETDAAAMVAFALRVSPRTQSQPMA